MTASLCNLANNLVCTIIDHARVLVDREFNVDILPCTCKLFLTAMRQRPIDRLINIDMHSFYDFVLLPHSNATMVLKSVKPALGEMTATTTVNVASIGINDATLPSFVASINDTIQGVIDKAREQVCIQGVNLHQHGMRLHLMPIAYSIAPGHLIAIIYTSSLCCAICQYAMEPSTQHLSLCKAN